MTCAPAKCNIRTTAAATTNITSIIARLPGKKNKLQLAAMPARLYATRVLFLRLSVCLCVCHNRVLCTKIDPFSLSQRLYYKMPSYSENGIFGDAIFALLLSDT